ncbi:MAG: hypothetical protein QXM92_02900 [Candidatus Anstonellales archaeon]
MIDMKKKEKEKKEEMGGGAKLKQVQGKGLSATATATATPSSSSIIRIIRLNLRTMKITAKIMTLLVLALLQIFVAGKISAVLFRGGGGHREE